MSLIDEADRFKMRLWDMLAKARQDEYQAQMRVARLQRIYDRAADRWVRRCPPMPPPFCSICLTEGVLHETEQGEVWVCRCYDLPYRVDR